METINNYIKKIQAKGKIMFSIEEILDELTTTRSIMHQAVARLKKKGELVSPYRGLYVIVPHHQANFGCIPAHELVPLLMDRFKANYYVAFLSAGQYYGAAHQKPMIFQVVSDKRIKNIHCGHVRIHFTYKQDISNIPVNKRVVSTGYLNVSTPEATAMDIINFQKEAVGINNIATVLSELIEEINIPKLIEMAKISKQKAWVQRMGYILEHIDSLVEDHRRDIIDALYKHLSSKQPSFLPLSQANPRLGTRNKKWKIIENTTVESDI